ncbi:MAG TPA: DUF5952 family protein [Chitinophaga sp.]|uniref:DUF5952 family protein n=1 Tax=Chitinophaga sp. TaxID=1869181 RepID=UPI002C1947C3|nr:DUF5952 family protein [Chitinophaga sp.]HVI43220.1 DUF5952 family protein [Chitinophaga sp.]
MRTYLLNIRCELLNEAGVLVARTLKATVHEEPHKADIYMFIMDHHFKPVIIQLVNEVRSRNDFLREEFFCEGEEIDETENIREVVPQAAFTITD